MPNIQVTVVTPTSYVISCRAHGHTYMFLLHDVTQQSIHALYQHWLQLCMGSESLLTPVMVLRMMAILYVHVRLRERST